MVIALAAALVTGASLAIPLQDAKATSDHHKRHGNSVNVKNNENQGNACNGDMTMCTNILTNIDCIHSTCIIGSITPWPTLVWPVS